MPNNSNVPLNMVLIGAGFLNASSSSKCTLLKDLKPKITIYLRTLVEPKTILFGLEEVEGREGGDMLLTKKK